MWPPTRGDYRMQRGRLRRVRRLTLALILILIACDKHRRPFPNLSKEPTSVRGWINDVEGSAPPGERSIEMETARRAQLFQATSVWVENAPYVSGGVAENGAFILLDVPPGNVTISFRAPGIEATHFQLQNIPGNADVFIPNLLLKKNGVTLLDPEGVKVRIPATVPAPLPTNLAATVAGKNIFAVQTPLAAMVDRRDYPEPAGFRPVATYK